MNLKEDVAGRLAALMADQERLLEVIRKEKRLPHVLLMCASSAEITSNNAKSDSQRLMLCSVTRRANSCGIGVYGLHRTVEVSEEEALLVEYYCREVLNKVVKRHLPADIIRR